MKETKPVASLSMKTLIRECSLKKCSNQELAKMYANAVYEHHVHKIFRYRRYEYDFSDHMTLYNDDEQLFGYFRPSYYDFLYNVLHSLGIKTKGEKIVDDEELTEKMFAQLRKLNKIESERQLKEEFPLLFRDLAYGAGRLLAARTIDTRTPEGQQKYDKETKYCYSCGIKQNLNHFIEDQTRVYSRFITRRKDYKENIEKASYNHFIEDHFDRNKVAMYIIYEYLRTCEKSESKEEIMKYLSLIKKYKESDFDKTVSLRSDRGELINWSMLQEKIRKVEKKLQELKNDILVVEWELLPNGSRVVSKDSNSKAQVMIMDQERINSLKSFGERKREFYESTPYVGKVIGLLKYKGYIAYIYENGEVLLDRKYNENAPSTAKGDAIYNFKVENFEELSYHTKTYLQNDERVERIIHSPHWEAKAKAIIEREASEADKEKVKTFIKKIKERQ